MLRASPRLSGIFLGAAVALAVGAAGAAASQEQRTYTGGRFYMDISGNRGVIGRAEGEAHGQRIEVEILVVGRARHGPAGRHVRP